MNTIFVDVDTQSDFINASGKLYIDDAECIKTNLRKINDLAKEQNITVIKTMDAHDGSEPEMISNGGTFPLHCMKGSAGQLSIKETENDKAIIFEKRCYNVFDKKFGNNDIENWLKKNKVKKAWVYGVATDYCVKAAVLGLCKLGIETYIFQNAIMGVNKETTEIAIKEMRKAGAHFAVAKL